MNSFIFRLLRTSHTYVIMGSYYNILRGWEKGRWEGRGRELKQIDTTNEKGTMVFVWIPEQVPTKLGVMYGIPDKGVVNFVLLVKQWRTGGGYVTPFCSGDWGGGWWSDMGEQI